MCSAEEEVDVVVRVLDDRSDLTVTTKSVCVAHSSQPIILSATAAITYGFTIIYWAMCHNCKKEFSFDLSSQTQVKH